MTTEWHRPQTMNHLYERWPRYYWPADWTTPRTGQNIAGNRYVCPTLAPNPLEDATLPECMAVTVCDRCGEWVCEDHADDNYTACDNGIHCRPCHEGHACPDLFCRDD